MEQVGVENNFSAVIEEHSVRVVRELVAESVLRGEVDELYDELGARLVLSLLDEQVVVESQSDGRLDLGQLR